PPSDDQAQRAWSREIPQQLGAAGLRAAAVRGSGERLRQSATKPAVPGTAEDQRGTEATDAGMARTAEEGSGREAKTKPVTRAEGGSSWHRLQTVDFSLDLRRKPWLRASSLHFSSMRYRERKNSHVEYGSPLVGTDRSGSHRLRFLAGPAAHYGQTPGGA